MKLTGFEKVEAVLHIMLLAVAIGLVVGLAIHEVVHLVKDHKGKRKT